MEGLLKLNDMKNKDKNNYISRSKYSKLYGVGKTIIDMRIANGVLKEKDGKVKWVKY